MEDVEELSSSELAVLEVEWWHSGKGLIMGPEQGKCREAAPPLTLTGLI